MVKYQCHWCDGWLEPENALAYQRRNAFGNWLGTDYYHPECYPKWQQRQAEISKEEEGLFNVMKWGMIIVAAVAIIAPIVGFFILPHITWG